jgi:hypothetical protein
MLRLFPKTTNPSGPGGSAPRGQQPKRPRPPRDDIECSATLCAGGAFHRVQLIDVSKHGCKFFVDEERWVGERVQIALESYHSLGAIVRWYKDGKAGIQFAHQLTESQLVTWKNAVAAARARAKARQNRRNFWGEPVRGGTQR